MANTLVTKLKSSLNNDALPFFDAIKVQRKINSDYFRLQGSGTVTIYSPDGTLQIDEETPAQTVELTMVTTALRAVNFVNDTQYAIVKGVGNVTGIDRCIICNELELGNAPLGSIGVNGIYHINKLPATIKSFQFGDSGADKGSVSGDLSELASEDILSFISYSNNTGITGQLSSFVDKYAATGFKNCGLDASQVEGDINVFKYLIENSTYAAASTSTTSHILSFNSAGGVTGSLDDLLTYLTGRVISKRILFSLRGSKCTYNGSAAGNLYVTFDESGDPTVTPQ